jgi:hypothetical protein
LTSPEWIQLSTICSRQIPPAARGKTIALSDNVEKIRPRLTLVMVFPYILSYQLSNKVSLATYQKFPIFFNKTFFAQAIGPQWFASAAASLSMKGGDNILEFLLELELVIGVRSFHCFSDQGILMMYG